MQPVKRTFVTGSMESRNLNNKFELKRFTNHILDNRYEKILILWGAEALVELLNWYQFIEYKEGTEAIIKCLKDYSEEYYL